ncbi:MAG: 2-oxoacid:acceptor oxidoreductase subunit alpha, partial [Alphaproteobacteria bacterium]
DMSQLTLDALKDAGLSKKDSLRCKNMWALGLVYWIFDRDRQSTADWLTGKFKAKPEIAAGTLAALNAGHAFGETAEISADIGAFTVLSADIGEGVYHNVTGMEATAWGLVAGSTLAGLKMVFCSYPITPASGILHALARLKEYGIVTFQAEDEIAAVCAAIGASYAGAIAVTSSSGPGIALKTEGICLAAATELPLVVINSQRAGPSTGMPTKTEQSDLYQAVFGRNADSPLVVLAARSPADCFETTIEAVRLAIKYMTPVMMLSDGYIVNASEPWALPDANDFARFPAKHHRETNGFQPFQRDPETLARVWAIPGTPGLEHRLGGLERDYDTGNVSYDPANHQRMTDVRAAKIAGVAREIPPQAVELGNESGPLAVVGWGSTYGPINRAVGNLRDAGLDVAHIHLRHIWPLPGNLGDLLKRYGHILVPEMNKGQLITLLRSEYLVPAEGLNKVTGKPFAIAEVEAAIRARMEA